ncbi:MAG: FAD-dependent monooxygenase [Chlamydiales bacterium]|nr:FAD-dependent monooxygenase [Chlamydiales bacterium]
MYLNHFFKERVCLLGDAGYCPSPMSGQGTSLALIGAYVLAGELALAKGDYRVAFTRYEQEMRPFIQANQELGIQAAKTFRSQSKKSPLSWLQGQIIRLIPGSVIQWLVKRSGKRIARAASSITLKDYGSLI